ncbi:MAG: 50S ribosomal protein L29 [Alphaproteobacteria bacterium RIFCSPLOWO2_01_FULL_45_8]|nr:MAG: 50S ribosomal protein L29 [Alphaproteobacteria bacterium GWB1_45_5]OFW76040.1 MAG: 50S ribosomal protein L29 [Alphaproteobacteria bacterium GWA1_45_9]OFW90081.1 MAG: 50S ribosomal protein L29 [Alphaproteobacteria bacterium RIFCSPHIGHO2_01_FULL_41_14]OFW96533.1 MAG: 50S ribosomal protein L29 [Alphaproteobacteria bacterium RIFCSPLOWO2_01_FULL_45_8]HCI48542.1 50S ribosomal protein L29 [Holosporales bacterium]
MKAIDLRKKKTDELKKMVLDLKKESFNLRFQKVAGQLTNTVRVREVRRSIARIKTLLNAGRKQK